MSFNCLLKLILIISISFMSNLMAMKQNLDNYIKEDFINNPAEDSVNMGNSFFKERNYKEALKWFLLAANQNHPEAQNHIGIMYFNGLGVKKNYEEAIKWYLLSANQNNSFAQKHIGFMYLGGFGVNQDYEEALLWFLKAYENFFSYDFGFYMSVTSGINETFKAQKNLVNYKFEN